MSETIELKCDVCGENRAVDREMADHFGKEPGDEVALHWDCGR